MSVSEPSEICVLYVVGRHSSWEGACVLSLRVKKVGAVRVCNGELIILGDALGLGSQLHLKVKSSLSDVYAVTDGQGLILQVMIDIAGMGVAIEEVLEEEENHKP